MTELLQFPDFALDGNPANIYGYRYSGIFEEIVFVIMVGIVGFSVFIDVLISIALLLFDADRHHGKVVIFCTFDIITGEDT